MAICPHCKCVFENVAEKCPEDGYYSVDEETFDPSDSLLGTCLDEKYILLKAIGRGGMGVVYLAKQKDLGRMVAIKILPRSLKNRQQAFDRFLREAASIGRISHPHIVKLYDFGVNPEGLAYLAMEWVDGRVLTSIAPDELSGQLITHIAQQCLSALEAAHSMQIIHRDLKPDNIMLTYSGANTYYVKVLDFGLASLMDESRISALGEALGTPWYMSPEQATATSVSPASDLYSLSCILYELVSSKPPFPGLRAYNVMMQHVNTPPPKIVVRPELEISRPFIDFIMRNLEKNPEKRHRSAKEALSELHKLPEWMAASLSHPSQSIRYGVSQLANAAGKTQDIDPSRTSATMQAANVITGEYRGAVSQGLSPLPLYMRLYIGIVNNIVLLGVAVLVLLAILLLWWMLL